jgi:hypothetical protein
MKFFGLVLVSFIMGSVSQADLSQYVGTYSEKHDVVMMNYANRAACQKDKGQWIQGLCHFDGSNELVVKVENDSYVMSVTTVTTNGHTCDFEAPAKLVSGKLVAEDADGLGWDEVKNEMVTKTCVVTATFSPDGLSASVDENNNCRNSCGANALLSIGKAVKVQ